MSEVEKNIITDLATYREQHGHRRKGQLPTPPQPQFNDLDTYALEMIASALESIVSTMPDDPSDNTITGSEHKFPIDPIEFGKQETNHVKLNPEV